MPSIIFDSSPLNRSSADGNSVRKWIGKQGCDPLIVFRSKNTTKLCYRSLIPWFLNCVSAIYIGIFISRIFVMLSLCWENWSTQRNISRRKGENQQQTQLIWLRRHGKVIHQIITTTNYPTEIMFSHSFTGFKWKDPVQSEHLRLSKQTNKQTVQHEPAVGALDMQSGGTGCKPLGLI